MEKKNQKVLIALYVFFILWMTLFSREVATVRVFKGLFWEATGPKKVTKTGMFNYCWLQ